VLSLVSINWMLHTKEKYRSRTTYVIDYFNFFISIPLYCSSIFSETDLVVRTLLNYEAYVSKQFVSGKKQCFSVKIYDYSVILLHLHTVSLLHKNPKRHKKRTHERERATIDQISCLCNLDSITQLTSKENYHLVLDYI